MSPCRLALGPLGALPLARLRGIALIVIPRPVLWGSQHPPPVFLRESHDLAPLGLDHRGQAGTSLQVGRFVSMLTWMRGRMASYTRQCSGVCEPRAGDKTYLHPRSSCTPPTFVPVAGMFPDITVVDCSIRIELRLVGMGSGIVISLVAVVTVLIAVLIDLGTRRRRRRHLKQSFGPEYDRAVLEQLGDTRRAEAALANRAKRVHAFHLRALSAVDREEYAAEWMAAHHFVDNPSATVGAAARLIYSAMTDRGYPEADFEQRAADLSVSYPTFVQNYRAAHEIVARHDAGLATTDELRQAVVYYRSLFDALLEPSKDEFPEPVWDEMFAPPKDELLKPSKDEFLEPSKIEEIDWERRRVTRERAS
jgi:hypothetical protein